MSSLKVAGQISGLGRVSRVGLSGALMSLAAILWANPGVASTGGTAPLGQTSVPDAVEALGLSQYSNVFLGDALENNESQLVVYLTSLSPSIESALETAAPGVSIEFIQTANSESTLASVQSAITSAAPSLEAQGIQLETWGGGLDPSGQIVITVANLTASQAEVLYGEFGASTISVQDATPATTPHMLAGRISDSSPWNGSDVIGADYPPGDMSECTTGFGIQSSYIGSVTLTAGHCFPIVQAVENEEIGASGWDPSSGAPTVGAITNQAQINDTIDSELISGTPSGYVWGGPIGSPVGLPVQGYTSNPVGDDVCTDGGLEGEYGSNSSPAYCGSGTGSGYIEITDNGTEDGSDGLCATTGYATATSPYFVSDTVCHLVKAVSSDSEPIVGNGDSGGPVFRFTNSGSDLYAVGEIDIGLNSVSCVNNKNPSGRACYSTVEYTAMSSVLSYWGATMVDG